MSSKKSGLHDVHLDFAPQRLQISQHNTVRPHPGGDFYALTNPPRFTTSSNSARAKHFRGAQHADGQRGTTASSSLFFNSTRSSTRNEDISRRTQKDEPPVMRSLPMINDQYAKVCKAIQDLLDREVNGEFPASSSSTRGGDSRAGHRHSPHPDHLDGHEVAEECCLCTKTDVAPNFSVETISVRDAVRITHLFNPTADRLEREADASLAQARAALQAKPAVRNPLDAPDEDRFKLMLDRVEASLAAADPEGEALLQTYRDAQRAKEQEHLSNARSGRRQSILSSSLHLTPAAAAALSPGRKEPVSSMGSSSVPSLPEINPIAVPPPPTPMPVPPTVAATDSLRSLMASREQLVRSRTRAMPPFAQPRFVPMTPRMGHERDTRRKEVAVLMETFMVNV